MIFIDKFRYKYLIKSWNKTNLVSSILRISLGLSEKIITLFEISSDVIKVLFIIIYCFHPKYKRDVVLSILKKNILKE